MKRLFFDIESQKKSIEEEEGLTLKTLGDQFWELKLEWSMPLLYCIAVN